MDAAKCQIDGSDYIGAFATTTEKYTFVPHALPEKVKALIEKILKTKCISISVAGTDLIGLFCRANSNGLIISNIASDEDIKRIKDLDLGMNIAVIKSSINAIGNTVLANDRIAIIDPEYSIEQTAQIGDALGVEVVRLEIGGFKTVGATNILTNKGLAINNHGTEREKAELDKITGFDSVRTTANTGSLSIGLASVANSAGVVTGDETTGFELNRIIQALD
ncbi:MAG TPA: translation initiation factor IF-6 [Candidatus Acidoferrum sp.]|nr:translation initiation factor IF-6 [Candidatus Acidoferrum sp.]